MNTPLAERMRPLTLDDYVGQEHILGKEAPLRKSMEAGVLPSMIFWGPPGVGKTTLANLISRTMNRPFYKLSAISSGVKDVREIIQQAENGGMFQQGGSILFIDEIHRFSKSQQDSLLGAVEKGTLTLIGATTENPSFEVISALRSRCQIYVLKHHEKSDLELLLNRAIQNDSWLKQRNVQLKETESLLAISGGDARKLLNILELIVGSNQNLNPLIIDNDFVLKNAQQSLADYDKNGEQHYDIVSAFIKSIRGSDPNGSVYWLARMIAGGEDPKFIARRMLILASEDIGLANPNALLLANATFDAVEKIGWPESRIILSQCALFLATSPKGNASYKAINLAQKTVAETGDLPVPLHLRNAPSKLMEDLGYGEGYLYAHDFPGNFITQEFLPDALQSTNFFKAGSSPKEQEIAKNIYQLWKEKYDANA
ncbi:MAG: replication-associated recombination protein A [Flavobacteriia bacterium]|jgi:putative ATPase|nr:replication-associated recombination protein A [Flavobacteriia bacterium]NBV68476.1 replication-associated recombination protein A [Flavobacteriia bacterium]NBV92143.1 replication-associated recombination protein A [Flavobacteriia bacterium]NBY40265.1 replication-associated recombination protein A [Flavobacteriia bacterium]